MVSWLRLSVFKNVSDLKEAEACHREIKEDVRKALEEWRVALAMFEEAVEQDQIDYAIFTLQAAERRYQMYLRKAKRYGVVGSAQDIVSGVTNSDLVNRVGGSM